MSHSAHQRDLILWRAALAGNPEVDLVVPILPRKDDEVCLDIVKERTRVFPLPAVELYGRGHSSMWVKGLRKHVSLRRYDLLHVAFEPWAFIPQFFCGRLPTVVHGAESILCDAPIELKLRRVGTKRVLRKAAGVLTWGHTSLQEFHRLGLPSKTPQGVIPVGIPHPDRFIAAPISNLGGPLRVLFVGRIVQEKGILTLINALGRLNRPVHLKILGEGSQLESISHLADDISDLELTIGGTVNEDGVVRAMAWSHVVVVPSQSTKSWKEQWGRVAVEAMMSGRPTVVSDSGELPNLMMKSRYTFPAGDVRALAALLDELDSQRELLTEIGAEMRRSVEHFSPEILAEHLYRFWEEVASFVKVRNG